jgi:signal transduction histidine kinase
VVLVARHRRDYDLLAATQVRILFLLLPVALIAAGAGALFLTNRALRPISAVTKAAATIGAEDLSRRLPVQGEDELDQLASTFNDMIARLEGSFTDLQEAYDNQRRFTADASHELRTPLTRLQITTSAALNETDPEKLLNAVHIAHSSTEAMSRLVHQLLTLSRADAGNLGLQLTPSDLRVAAAEAVDSLHHAGRSIETVLDDQPVVANADGDQLRRVIVNLIENALRYTGASGLLIVRVGKAETRAFLEVEDNGEGIPPEHLPRVFERFYRADSARAREDGGCGLGLSISKSIVEAHGGQIQILSEQGKGTKVQIFLPLK